MKMLRSQYLKMQNGSSDQLVASKKSNIVPNEGEKRAKGMEIPNVARTSMQLRPRKPKDCSASHANASNIKILIEHFDETLKKINIVVEFIDMNATWLTRVYKTYENDLWRKEPRLSLFGRKKWFYYCELCSSSYKEFFSIKNHLNLHMNFYPYICKLCGMKYTNRKSATSHLRKTHKIDRDQWNDFLTS